MVCFLKVCVASSAFLMLEECHFHFFRFISSITEFLQPLMLILEVPYPI